MGPLPQGNRVSEDGHDGRFGVSQASWMAGHPGGLLLTPAGKELTRGSSGSRGWPGEDSTSQLVQCLAGLEVWALGQRGPGWQVRPRAPCQPGERLGAFWLPVLLRLCCGEGSCLERNLGCWYQNKREQELC